MNLQNYLITKFPQLINFTNSQIAKIIKIVKVANRIKLASLPKLRNCELPKSFNYEIVKCQIAKII